MISVRAPARPLSAKMRPAVARIFARVFSRLLCRRGLVLIFSNTILTNQIVNTSGSLRQIKLADEKGCLWEELSNHCPDTRGRERGRAPGQCQDASSRRFLQKTVWGDFVD